MHPIEQDHLDKEDDCGNVGLEHQIKSKTIQIELNFKNQIQN